MVLILLGWLLGLVLGVLWGSMAARLAPAAARLAPAMPTTITPGASVAAFRLSPAAARVLATASSGLEASRGHASASGLEASGAVYNFSMPSDGEDPSSQGVVPKTFYDMFEEERKNFFEEIKKI